MRVKYLGNSGFAIGIDRQLFIFDDISKGAYIRQEALKFFDTLIVLASHAHSDHYDPDIFKMSVIREKNTHFVLSADIIDTLPQTIPSVGEIYRINEGGELSLDGVTINAYGSTDQGVSFNLTIPFQGKNIRIFHAGDLNDWHWLNENNTLWTQQQGLAFTKILNTIPVSPRIDLAFFPFDPRMGNDYELGAVKFVNLFAPAMVVPMHFGKQWVEPEGFISKIESKSLLCPLGTLGASFDAVLNNEKSM